MSLAPSPWLDAARGVSLVQVAHALALEVRRQSIGPCPACGSAQRGRADRRYPVGVTGNGLGWRCHACKAGGDGPALVRHALGRGTTFASVRDWFATQRWVEPAESFEGALSATAARRYPPYSEVNAVLRACTPPGTSVSCRAFLAARGLPRDVPAGTLPAPSWLGWETLSDLDTGEDAQGAPRSWWLGRWAGLWRLVVPAVDAHGVIRSFQARAVRDGAKHKTKWPAGCRADGLLFADPLRARPALRGGPWPEMVLLVEGLTDYLAACAAVLHEEPRLEVAVLGMTSGSADALLKARVPADRVVSALDPDETGDRYHRTVCELLGSGVRRMCLDGPTQHDTRRGPDLAEALQGGMRLGELLQGASPC